MNKHTPGPWALSDDALTESEEIAVISIPRAVTVARCEELADARLVAAAPELLAALRELVDLQHMKHDFTKLSEYKHRKPFAWNRARALVAHLEGKP